ncbi:MAG: hypothetical protein O7D86_02385 [Proteobacteria bacterium]|nr:hypothetical protein [Pseudomonadota bacterium]
MKVVSDPEFLLLRKAQEIKKRMRDSEEIDELIKMAEGIVDQNIKGALLYMMTAIDQAEIKDGDLFQEMFSKIIERRSKGGK